MQPGGNLYNCDSCLFISCSVEGTDAKGRCHRLGFLHIIFLPPKTKLHQHIIISGGNPAAYKTDEFVRAWLATIVRIGARYLAFYRTNPFLYV